MTRPEGAALGFSLAALILMLGCNQTASPSPESAESPLKPTPSAAAEAPPFRSLAVTSSERSAFVAQQVVGLQEFLAQFKSNAELREKAGVQSVTVSQKSDEENRVLIHYVLESEAQLKTFLGSAAYEQALLETEVTETMLMWLATNELRYEAAQKGAESASLFKKFSVADFEVLKSGLAANMEEIFLAGALSFSLHRSSLDPQVAIIHLVVQDLSRAQQIYESDWIQKVFKDAGCERTAHPILGVDLNLDAVQH